MEKRGVPVFSELSQYNGDVQFQIRAFHKSDFDVLWEIDQACFDPELAYSRRELAFYMARPGAMTLVAEGESGASSAGIVGFVVAEARRKLGHIITIDVVPDCRRAGIGSALMEAAEQKLRDAGVEEIELETPVNNSSAISFYKRKGYFVEKTTPKYYSKQLDALVMRKELKAGVRSS